MTKTTGVIGVIVLLMLVFISGAYLMYQANPEENVRIDDENLEPREDDSQVDSDGQVEFEQFVRWGNIVNIDDLTAELVYEEPGKPALTVDLVFTMETLCVIDGQEATCPLFSTSPLFEQGARVYVEGEKDGDIVVVRKITEEASSE